MSRLLFSPRFRRDAVAAARYYERQQQGLGADFQVEIERTVNRILDFPLSGILLDSHLRRQTVRRFPYHILYRVDEEQIFVLSVVHQRRRPGAGFRR